MKVKLKDVKANPFRDLDRYPIKSDKIQALIKSIEDTEFWDNIVARKVGAKVEIAYGHHRLAALREMYGPSHQIDLIIRNLDDTAMAKIMAHENMEEWGSQADVEQETIRAIVQGYADGRIELGEVALKTSKKHIRYAPSFLQDAPDAGKEHPYTVDLLVTFLGWNEWRVRTSLQSLEAIERADISESQFEGLTTKQAQSVVVEVNKSIRSAEKVAKRKEAEGNETAATKIRREAKKEAKAVAGAIVKGIKKEGKGTRDAVEIAERVRHGGQVRDKVIPDIDAFAKSMATKIHSFLDDDKEVGKKLKEIIKHKKHLSPGARKSLVGSLNALQTEAKELKSKL